MTWILGGGSATDWSEARDKVRGDLWRTGSTALPDDVVDRALHASILEIEARRKWLWLHNVLASLTLEVAADTISLPLTCGPLHSLSVVSGKARERVEMLPSVAAVREWSGTSNSIPLAFARSGDGLLYLDSKAPAGTVFEVIFDARTPPILEDAMSSQSIALMQHQQAVLAGAKKYVCLEYLHDTDKAARQGAAFEAHLSRMEDADDLLRGDDMGGFIQPNATLFYAAHGRC